jgi:hypothetical protein
MNKWLSTTVFLASIGVVSTAQTAPYRHDGLYVACAAGLGYLSTSMTFDGSSADSGSFQIYGAGLAGSVFLGGTLARGLALGGGLYGATTPVTPRRTPPACAA